MVLWLHGAGGHLAVVFFSSPDSIVISCLSYGQFRARGSESADAQTLSLGPARRVRLGFGGWDPFFLMGALLGCGPRTFGWDGGPWPQSPLGDRHFVNGLLGTQCSLWLSFYLCKAKVSLPAPASGCCGCPCACSRSLRPGMVREPGPGPVAGAWLLPAGLASSPVGLLPPGATTGPSLPHVGAKICLLPCVSCGGV